MSFKTKDLHFDNSQPAFLQRLRGQIQNGDSSRHEQPVARNRKVKEEEDDAPAYVLEGTNQSLTKEEYEDLVSCKAPKEESCPSLRDANGASVEEGNVKPRDKIAEVGGNAKKRKVAKIVGDEPDEKVKVQTSKKQDTKAVKKSKKAKAVKLSFGDEEDG